MNRWECSRVPMRFQLSDWTLFTVPLRLQVRAERLLDESSPVSTPTPPVDELMEGKV